MNSVTLIANYISTVVISAEGYQLSSQKNQVICTCTCNETKENGTKLFHTILLIVDVNWIQYFFCRFVQVDRLAGIKLGENDWSLSVLALRE